MTETEEQILKKVKFQPLDGTELPFKYTRLANGICIADKDANGLDLAEENGLIKILDEEFIIPRFLGGPEPIQTEGKRRIVQPAKGPQGYDGEILEFIDFGGWQCVRCDYITYTPLIDGKLTSPYECENNTCKRKTGFKPLFSKELVKTVWKLASEPIPCGGAEIYTDIFNFAKKYLILKEHEYHILSLWIMASWLVDDFQTAPYLALIAPKSSGKTQVLNVLSELAYRAISTVSVTAPALFRSIELWHVTLLVDEAEFQVKGDTESGQALYGCLNGGYKRGSYALRIEGDANSRIPAAYETFGFKAVASTRLFLPTLESRSIVFSMTQGTPSKILIDIREAEIIRSKLIWWRFETMGKLNQIIPESKIGRLIEMFVPLFTVAQVLKNKTGQQTPIMYDDLVSLLKNQIKDMEKKRNEEESASTEGLIIEAIEKIKGRAPAEKAYILIAEIATEMRWTTDESTQKEDNLARAKLGRIIKAMGISAVHKKDGNAILHKDDEVKIRLTELANRFLPSPATVKDNEG